MHVVLIDLLAWVRKIEFRLVAMISTVKYMCVLKVFILDHHRIVCIRLKLSTIAERNLADDRLILSEAKGNNASRQLSICIKSKRT